MSISLSWFKEIFKSEKEKEKEQLEVEELKLRKQQLEGDIAYNKKWQEESKEEKEETKKPYLSLKLVNSSLTIVLIDGNILSKPNATVEDFKKAREATNEDQLFRIASSTEGVEELRKEQKEAAKIEALSRGVEQLKDLEDFEIIDNSVYLKGIKRSMPQLLVERFVELQGAYESDEHFTESTEYQSLKKFWMKCCLNPNAQSAEDLYGFLAHHQFKIDKHGNFYAYRRVVSTNTTNKELVEFISNAYNKVKAIWKKKPNRFEIVKFEGKYKLESSKSTSEEHSGEWVGNLEELYLELPNMQDKSYTSAHTRKEDYKVGEIMSMPRDEGDDNNNVSCSYGFHAASKAYDYSGFGDTPILVIINPMDVLAVPVGEWGKLRTCRWFFAMTLPEEEKYILDDEDFDVSELGDVFEEKCLKNMQEYVKNSFAEEVKRHTFTLSNISSKEVEKITLSLQEMKDTISKRVVEVE